MVIDQKFDGCITNRITVSTYSQSNKTSFRNSSTFTKSKMKDSSKLIKMNEAYEWENKAKQALTKSVFKRKHDPIVAGMCYHRASELYKICAEYVLEKLCRIAAGDCHIEYGAYESAAAEYCRAAHISFINDNYAMRKTHCYSLYDKAANAWDMVAGERDRAANCRMKAVLSLTTGNECFNGNDDINLNDFFLLRLDKKVLVSIESVIESHVPDPVNRYGNFRKSGTIAYFNTDEKENNIRNVTNELTSSTVYDRIDQYQENIVTSTYISQLHKAIHKLVEFREYQSALYAAGAASAILEKDDVATISLSRSYFVETLLALAIGDVVIAEKTFIQVHLQNKFYLSSRECKFAEELIMVVKIGDSDALERARSPSGNNRAALSNLDIALRDLLKRLTISGVTKKCLSNIKQANGKNLCIPDENNFTTLRTMPVPNIPSYDISQRNTVKTSQNLSTDLHEIINIQELVDDNSIDLR